MFPAIARSSWATHSPMLMAYPDARLLRLSNYGLEPVTVKQTDHYKGMREFCDDPAGFVEAGWRSELNGRRDIYVAARSVLRRVSPERHQACIRRPRPPSSHSR
jgi:hypothetical protein